MNSKKNINEWLVPLTVITLALYHAKQYGAIAVGLVSVLFVVGYVFLDYQKNKNRVNG
ncbi:MAG: hypothetical protein ACPGWR_08035 [Ardenticatenaceae bacterium]